MNIEWGVDGCVRDPGKTTARGRQASSQLQEEFDAVVRSSIRFDVPSVRFEMRRSEIVQKSATHYELLISRFQHKESWFWDILDPDRRRYGMIFGGACRLHTAMFTEGSLIVHEFGHAFEAVNGRNYRLEAPAVRRENIYHGIHNQAQRCGLPTETF